MALVSVLDDRRSAYGQAGNGPLSKSQQTSAQFFLNCLDGGAMVCDGELDGLEIGDEWIGVGCRVVSYGDICAGFIVLLLLYTPEKQGLGMWVMFIYDIDLVVVVVVVVVCICIYVYVG